MILRISRLKVYVIKRIKFSFDFEHVNNADDTTKHAQATTIQV